MKKKRSFKNRAEFIDFKWKERMIKILNQLNIDDPVQEDLSNKIKTWLKEGPNGIDFEGLSK